MLDFLHSRSSTLDILLSLARSPGAPTPQTQRAAQAWTLRQRGLVLDSLVALTRVQVTPEQSDVFGSGSALRKIRLRLRALPVG